MIVKKKWKKQSAFCFVKIIGKLFYRAEKIQCNNWNSSDSYGNYRKAQLTQIKHHFWWKMNYVFDAIMEKYKLSTNVLLLEEDHMVTPDIFHVLDKILDFKKE